MQRNELEMTDVISAETMQGDTPLEREINAYLTKQFIWPRDMPTDECLSEAKHIIALVDILEPERYEYRRAFFNVCDEVVRLFPDDKNVPAKWEDYLCALLQELRRRRDGDGQLLDE